MRAVLRPYFRIASPIRGEKLTLVLERRVRDPIAGRRWHRLPNQSISSKTSNAGFCGAWMDLVFISVRKPGRKRVRPPLCYDAKV